MTGLAVPLLLLGLLTLLGTAGYLVAARDLPAEDVPSCIRRRVRAFAAHVRGIAVAATSAAVLGVALVLLEGG